MTAGWGPQHAPGLPGGIRYDRPGGYWWAITIAAAVALLLCIGAHAELGWPLAAQGIMAVIGAGVGLHEARTGVGFACGRWIAFALAALLSIPFGIAYGAAFFVRTQWPRWEAQRAARRGARFEAEHERQDHADAGGGEWPRLAGGFFGVDDRGQPVTANARGAALVVGPPGSGKTSCVINNSVAYAPAACVSTSIKTEVMAATVGIRAQLGTCWWFDPGGAGGEQPPAGVERLRWNPLVDVTDWAAALSVAARLTGPLRPADGGGDHWLDKAETWLAVLLYAASQGPGLERLAEWCRAPEMATDAVEAQLLEADTLNGDRGAQVALSVLGGITATAEKERSSIASTLSRITKLYNNPAAIDAGADPNFDPAAFVRSSDTVYITAPSSAQADYAPLIAGLLESIRTAQEARRQRIDMGDETQSAPVTFVLDEASNTAPIPLPAIASTAGGQGLHLVVAVQEPNQVRQRWGTAGEGFMTLFPDKLILSGMADERWCSMLSKMSGEYDRMTTSLSGGSESRSADIGLLFNSTHTATTGGPSVSYSTQRTPQLSVADVSGVPFGRGLYFSRGGWRLLHLRLFDADQPIGPASAAGGTRADRPAYMPGGPSWLTPKRLVAVGISLIAVLVAAFLVIPALSGHHDSGSDSTAAPAAALPSGLPAAGPADGPAAATPPHWDGDWLRGYWTSPPDCDNGQTLWIVQADNADSPMYRLRAGCFTPSWLASIRAQYAAATWGGDGTLALADPRGVFNAYGTVGDLQLVQLGRGCQFPGDATKLAAGPIPADCIYHPLTQ